MKSAIGVRWEKAERVCWIRYGERAWTVRIDSGDRPSDVAREVTRALLVLRKLEAEETAAGWTEDDLRRKGWRWPRKRKEGDADENPWTGS